MPRNVEVKARIGRVEALLPAARALADGEPVAIAQDDTFFAVPHGRLKLRRFADGSAELIHYHRPDTAGARTSDYVRVPLADAGAADALHAALARAAGTLGRVRKQRLLLTSGATRIHLDRVDGLGDFVELEAVLRPGQPDAEGHAAVDALMRGLGLADAPRIAGAYCDLLRERR